MELIYSLQWYFKLNPLPFILMFFLSPAAWLREAAASVNLLHGNYSAEKRRMKYLTVYTAVCSHKMLSPKLQQHRNSNILEVRGSRYHQWHDSRMMTIVFQKAEKRKWLARCEFKQVAQLSQRDRAAGWVSYGQKWKTVNGRQHFTDIIGLSSTTMT